jgi:hypothetical protein
MSDAASGYPTLSANVSNKDRSWVKKTSMRTLSGCLATITAMALVLSALVAPDSRNPLKTPRDNLHPFLNNLSPTDLSPSTSSSDGIKFGYKISILDIS